MKTSLTNWPKRTSMIGVDVELHPIRRKRKMKTTTGMDLKTLLRSVECNDVNPLHKLMLIGGKADSNSVFQNFTGLYNVGNFWIR